MLHLSELVKHGQQTESILLDERLPVFLKAPCRLTATYNIENKDDFYLVNLNVAGDVIVTCQRCMDEFNLAYDNSIILAVCRSDERAEQLLEHYECIVSSNWHVDLKELIIDELHLYVSPFHQEISDCDNKINEILAGKNETY
ncbi:MAG: YceD family protein [Proteobacteria bacterium]|nr:YceD family protein [Pseudomonadota bacterium]